MDKTFRPCSVTGCERVHFGLTYCQKHYLQFKKHGTVKPVGVHGNAKDVIEYRAAHRRVEAVRGKARIYFCVECNEQAQEWSLEPGTPDLLYSTVANSAGKPYSLDVYAYSPRCIYHHRLLDGMPPVPGRRNG